MKSHIIVRIYFKYIYTVYPSEIYIRGRVRVRCPSWMSVPQVDVYLGYNRERSTSQVDILDGYPGSDIPDRHTTTVE